jgi:hypothetical protein
MEFMFGLEPSLTLPTSLFRFASYSSFMIHSNSTHTDLIFVFISYLCHGRIYIFALASRPLRDRSPTVAVRRASRCPHDRRPSRLLLHCEKLLMHLSILSSSIALIRASLQASIYHRRRACLLLMHARSPLSLIHACATWHSCCLRPCALLLLHANSVEFNSCLFAAVAQPLSRRHWSAPSSPFYRSAAASCQRTWSCAADHVVVPHLRPSSPSNDAAIANHHQDLITSHEVQERDTSCTKQTS